MTTRKPLWRTAALVLTVALLGCGGDDAASPSPEARNVELDADALLSVEAARQAAADARGAPGEAEPVAYLVRARRRADALRLVGELEALGFGPLFVLP